MNRGVDQFDARGAASCRGNRTCTIDRDGAVDGCDVDGYSGRTIHLYRQAGVDVDRSAAVGGNVQNSGCRRIDNNRRRRIDIDIAAHSGDVFVNRHRAGDRVQRDVAIARRGHSSSCRKAAAGGDRVDGESVRFIERDVARGRGCSKGGDVVGVLRKSDPSGGAHTKVCCGDTAPGLRHIPAARLQPHGGG